MSDSDPIPPREFLNDYRNALIRHLASVGKTATGKEWEVSMNVLDDFISNMEKNNIVLVQTAEPPTRPQTSRIKGVISYSELGRSKAKGTFKVDAEGAFAADNVNARMLREFSRHLMSSDISFTDGTIYAGMRPVGKYIAVFEEGSI